MRDINESVQVGHDVVVQTNVREHASAYAWGVNGA